MKKLIFLPLFALAFGVCANAQSKTKKNKTAKTVVVVQKNRVESSINDINSIDTIVKLDPSFKKDLVSLMSMREEALNNAKTIDEKKIIFNRFGTKLLAGLNEEQRAKLENVNPALAKSFLEYKE